MHVRRRQLASWPVAIGLFALGTIAMHGETARGDAPAAPASAKPDVKPASGGGDAPHGALAMDKQLAQVSTLQGGDAPSGAAPQGVDPAYWATLAPADNAPSAARIALGKKLYFDPKVSKDGTVACATCHDSSRGFTDRRNTSEGIGDQIGQRNAPTTMNAVFFSSEFLDGRAASLEEQAKLPILNPIEMGQPDGNAVVAGISGDATYQKEFQDAYSRAPNYDDVGRALAAYERTLIFTSAPFDRFLAGDATAISDDAKAGWALYNGKARCASCHQISSNNPIGTDNKFHNVGVSATHQNFEDLALKALAIAAKDNSKQELDRLALETNLSELGRFMVTKNRADIGGFKTQGVRNVGVTAPYMHDGSMATLWDVVDHYNKGGEANAYLDGGIEPLALTPKEEDQVVAFMFALTDDRLADQNKSEMTRQQGIAATRRPFRDDDLANRKTFPFEKRASGQK